MPNWIEGTFRCRGSKENITKFIMEGLQPISKFGCDEKLQREIEVDDDDYIEIIFTLNEQDDNQKRKHPKSLYIPHTKRNFVEFEGFGDISAKEIAVSMNEKGYIPTTERNFTAPRLTEMSQLGIVEPIGKKTCKYTKHKVTVYSLRESEAE